MLKKVKPKEGTPVIVAEAEWYILDQQDEDAEGWASDVIERMATMINGVNWTSEENLPKDAIMIADDLNSSAIYFMASDDPAATSCNTVMVVRQKIVYMTKGGRPFTPKERKKLLKAAQWIFYQTVTICGATCMHMDLDGKKFVWYNDDSCPEDHELAQ